MRGQISTIFTLGLWMIFVSLAQDLSKSQVNPPIFFHLPVPDLCATSSGLKFGLFHANTAFLFTDQKPLHLLPPVLQDCREAPFQPPSRVPSWLLNQLCLLPRTLLPTPLPCCVPALPPAFTPTFCTFSPFPTVGLLLLTLPAPLGFLTNSSSH